MKPNGFLMVEVLVATALLSLAGSSVYAALSQALKVSKSIHETDALHGPFKILWISAAKDLRNAVPLRDYPFMGKQDEVAFPVFTEASGLSCVRYFVKKGDLIKQRRKLPEKFVKERAAEEALVKGVEKLRFEYAYLDGEERLSFKPVWLEEPYFGIPKAVKVEIKLKNNGKVFSRLISIPQGRWGHE